MKKIYTLIALAAISFGANAQVDLAAEFTSYAEGSTVADDPMDGTIIITNVGETIPAGDTLTFGFLIDEGIYSLALDGGYYNFFELEEDFETGATLSFGAPELAWAALGIEVECCATVFGIGAGAVDELFAGDDDPSNNSQCITYQLPVDDSGIEDLGLTLSSVYVAGGQLMIVNEGVNGEASANLSIVNMNGQTVQTANFVMAQGTSSIALNNISAGIYIVAIEVEGVVATRKVAIH